jgi:hypothetical protein
LTKSLCFLHFLIDMFCLFSRDFSFNLIQYLRCSTIMLFYLKFGFWLYNKYMDYRFYFNWWWEILNYYWFYYFEQYHILKDHRNVAWFYIILVLLYVCSQIQRMWGVFAASLLCCRSRTRGLGREIFFFILSLLSPMFFLSIIKQ